jgi:hypothetical protein
MKRILTLTTILATLSLASAAAASEPCLLYNRSPDYPLPEAAEGFTLNSSGTSTWRNPRSPGTEYEWIEMVSQQVATFRVLSPGIALVGVANVTPLGPTPPKGPPVTYSQTLPTGTYIESLNIGFERGYWKPMGERVCVMPSVYTPPVEVTGKAARVRSSAVKR